ncbi:sensor histidine kinase, partial [Anabaena sp. CS-542/02]|uniref:sensor histidine kinase n=1 Tax=Anabaena sp. CS-542/02 TaxID=3021719 RepID=UPI00232B431B
AILQTLTNLLGNAIKFSRPGGTVELSVSMSEEDILFTITDQGKGIPPEKLEAIFGRFQQVDVSDARQKGGTGLGLAICRSIVEEHQGKIWAESVLNSGSTFYFTIPIKYL